MSRTMFFENETLGLDKNVLVHYEFFFYYHPDLFNKICTIQITKANIQQVIHDFETHFNGKINELKKILRDANVQYNQYQDKLDTSLFISGISLIQERFLNIYLLWIFNYMYITYYKIFLKYYASINVLMCKYLAQLNIRGHYNMVKNIYSAYSKIIKSFVENQDEINNMDYIMNTFNIINESWLRWTTSYITSLDTTNQTIQTIKERIDTFESYDNLTNFDFYLFKLFINTNPIYNDIFPSYRNRDNNILLNFIYYTSGSSIFTETLFKRLNISTVSDNKYDDPLDIKKQKLVGQLVDDYLPKNQHIYDNIQFIIEKYKYIFKNGRDMEASGQECNQLNAIIFQDYTKQTNIIDDIFYINLLNMLKLMNQSTLIDNIMNKVQNFNIKENISSDAIISTNMGQDTDMGQDEDMEHADDIETNDQPQIMPVPSHEPEMQIASSSSSSSSSSHLKKRKIDTMDIIGEENTDTDPETDISNDYKSEDKPSDYRLERPFFKSQSIPLHSTQQDNHTNVDIRTIDDYKDIHEWFRINNLVNVPTTKTIYVTNTSNSNISVKKYNNIQGYQLQLNNPLELVDIGNPIINKQSSVINPFLYAVNTCGQGWCLWCVLSTALQMNIGNLFDFVFDYCCNHLSNEEQYLIASLTGYSESSMNATWSREQIIQDLKQKYKTYADSNANWPGTEIISIINASSCPFAFRVISDTSLYDFIMNEHKKYLFYIYNHRYHWRLIIYVIPETIDSRQVEYTTFFKTDEYIPNMILAPGIIVCEDCNEYTKFGVDQHHREYIIRHGFDTNGIRHGRLSNDDVLKALQKYYYQDTRRIFSEQHKLSLATWIQPNYIDILKYIRNQDPEYINQYKALQLQVIKNNRQQSNTLFNYQGIFIHELACASMTSNNIIMQSIIPAHDAKTRFNAWMENIQDTLVHQKILLCIYDMTQHKQFHKRKIGYGASESNQIWSCVLFLFRYIKPVKNKPDTYEYNHSLITFEIAKNVRLPMFCRSSDELSNSVPEILLHFIDTFNTFSSE